MLVAAIVGPGSVSCETLRLAHPVRAFALQAAGAAAAANRGGLQAQSSPALVKNLRIVPLEGEGAVNQISTRIATAPVVEVRDENDLPVEGVQVTFQLPSSGPGATFGDGQHTLMTVTNSRGQAMARGFEINSVPGAFSIRITASLQSLKAAYIMTQTNQLKAVSARRGRKWLWITLAGAGAAAAGTTIALRRSDSSSILASAGPVVFGPPQ
jgi:hypothetical protein